MSKIGTYLQEHISGEVSLSRDVRESVSRDASVLKIKPEMVIYPKDTNDIRRITRFSWQLAERGHILPITARGAGGDQTGAAIGSGIILSTIAHMDRLFEFEPKQRLLRLQPGVRIDTLTSTLGLQGMRIPALPTSGTIGGAAANNASSALSGRYGPMAEWVDRLEVVLANGEAIQTGRINKRELSKKQGLGTLEGEIYRSIDGLIEENQEVIAQLSERTLGTSVGYSRISMVKRKDGSFDLTPLFLGSQGTLGIISEMIVKVAPAPSTVGVIVASFSDTEIARDVVDDIIAKQKPAFIETYDSAVFENATLIGKSFAFLQEPDFDVKTVVLIGFDDSAARKHIKKTKKLLLAAGAWFVSGENTEALKLLSMRDALIWTSSPDKVEFGSPSVLGSAYIPPEGASVFRAGLKTLSKKHSTQLPVYTSELQNLYYVWPQLNLKKSGDKQLLFKLIEDYAKLVRKVNGELVGTDAEGRLRGRFALNTFDDDALALFAAIKAAFDPYKILNPGVKEMLELKQLAPLVQSEPALPQPGNVPFV